MEPEVRDEGRTIDEYFDDFFTGSNALQSQWLTLPPLPSVSSVPTTPANPPLLTMPRSAPPPPQVPLPSIAVPLTLPPSRGPAPPQTPPRQRRLEDSPITPASRLAGSAVAGSSDEHSKRPQSAPCTPLNSVVLSPVTPISSGYIGNELLRDDEPFAPSAELARFICNRVVGTDSSPQYKKLRDEMTQFVENLKCNLRDSMREGFERDKSVLTPKERTRFRSRRGAAVSRFKVQRTKQTLEEAAVWCVAHLACPANTARASSSESSSSMDDSGASSMQTASSPHAPSSLTSGSIGSLSVSQIVCSPRTELANELNGLSMRTPPAGMVPSHSPYTPPVMKLPPAKCMESPDTPIDDKLLSKVTKVPVGNEVLGGNEFRLSAELQDALLSRGCVTQVEAMMDLVRSEVKLHVELKKGLVREEYKSRLNEMKEKLTVKSRMRGRSRRGAAVTRYKNTATIAAWEDALKWFIDNIYTAASESTVR